MSICQAGSKLLGFTAVKADPDAPLKEVPDRQRLTKGPTYGAAEARPAGGGPMGGTGYRYWTISVSNLQALVDDCKAGGYRVRVEPTEVRPGVTIAMVEDPDGNWVEFLQNG